MCTAVGPPKSCMPVFFVCITASLYVYKHEPIRLFELQKVARIIDKDEL